MHAPERHTHKERSPATVRSVRWLEDEDTVRRLFIEYRAWLADHRDSADSSQPRVKRGLALVDRLISKLPGAYGPPHGDLLLWFEEDSVVAVGAIRELEPKVGEIRRIYVRPDYRGKEFGLPFGRALIGRARDLGYERLKVDTLPSMTAAIEFYQELGFRPTAAFWPHPVGEARFFELRIPPSPP
jgi:GNAT superfamily N-acetyltransferase